MCITTALPTVCITTALPTVCIRVVPLIRIWGQYWLMKHTRSWLAHEPILARNVFVRTTLTTALSCLVTALFTYTRCYTTCSVGCGGVSPIPCTRFWRHVCHRTPLQYSTLCHSAEGCFQPLARVAALRTGTTSYSANSAGGRAATSCPVCIPCIRSAHVVIESKSCGLCG